jgi:PmbA protein
MQLSQDPTIALTDLCQMGKEHARLLGLDAIEISISQDTGYSIEVRKQSLDALSHQHNQHIGLTVYKNQAKGEVSGCAQTKEALIRLIEKASDIATYTKPDPAAGLAPKALLCKQVQDLSLYHAWDMPVNVAIDKAKELEQFAMDADSRIQQVEQAWINTYEGEDIYFNTECDHPLVQRKSNVSMGVSVIAHASNQMEQSYEYALVRDGSDLPTAESIAKKAVEKAVAKLGARSLSNRVCPVLFMPSAAKTLWSLLLSAISGRSIYQQSSFLTNFLGQSVLPLGFSLGQDPFIPKAMGSASFDQDGVQTQQMNYIEDGILQSYLLSQYSANRLGLVTTGNSGGYFNMSPQGPHDTFTSLVRQMQTGLLVSDFMGQGVDLSSGSFSKGINGFWVENGVIQYPVHHTSIAGNLKDMFEQIIAIASDDIDTRGSLRTGSVWIDQLSISGV